jgi:hypothetical protein
VRGGEKKPFEQVRAEIETEVRKALAQKKYAEAAEQFSETVYQQYDSLQPVIDKLKLEKRTATVARAPAPGASGPLASEKLLGAVFGNEAVKNKRNTDAVEVGPQPDDLGAGGQARAFRTCCRWPRSRTACEPPWSPNRPRRWHARKARHAWQR